MKYKDREGNLIESANPKQDDKLSKLYSSAVGRLLLKLLVRPFVSKITGFVLNRWFSRFSIHNFIQKNGINMKEYEKIKYKSFNDFFIRKIKPQFRPIDENPDHLISPCDAKLSAYKIDEELKFTVKGAEYTLGSLLRNDELAKSYIDGRILIFRLTPDDYHRYCYVDSGAKSENIVIPGVLHTVNPVVHEHNLVYRENSRSYTIIKSENFGYVLQMEVGALFVGKIVNYDGVCGVSRGDEKGRFEFGGSTIVMCIQKDKVLIDEDIRVNTKEGFETIVKYGSKIGIKSN